MRIVGTQDRSEIELDPVKAYQRGLALDRMMHGTLPPVRIGFCRARTAKLRIYAWPTTC
jgi:hypothetical protein